MRNKIAGYVTVRVVSLTSSVAPHEENSERTCAWYLLEASGGGERASS